MRARLIALVAVAACRHAPAPHSVEDDAARVTATADAYIRESLLRSPGIADFRGWPEAKHDRFGDNSLEALADWNGKVDALLAELDKVDEARLVGHPAWITLGFLREALESDRGLRVCRNELWAVDINGWQTYIGDVAAIQPVGTAEAREVAIARWRTYPAVLDTEVTNLREGLRLGYTAPRSTVDKVIAQLDAMLALAVEDSPFYDPAKRDAELAAPFAALIRDEIYPAVRRYRDFLADDYRGKAREALGVIANPDGEACWRASFRAMTSLDRDPAETVRLGEQRVADFAAEAQAIGEEAFGTRDLDAIRKRLAEDPENRFADGAEQLAFATAAVERAHAAMDRVVPVVPAAEVIVDPYPAYVGSGPSASYNPAPEDGSRPAKYNINLQQNPTRGEAEMVAFHEAWPGHHLQFAVAMELPESHRIRDLVGVASYSEGWARYAEALSEDLGLYTTPYAKIRRRIWPGRGMVVDPGIHLHGWTREQAVKYITDGGFASDFAEGLVDRIAAWPGQLTAYDTGAIEILALRREAEARLGDRFDVRAFNACVLSQGSVTLPMLRAIVERCQQ
jgi:uncharacterized protein (DUF885 family)